MFDVAGKLTCFVITDKVSHVSRAVASSTTQIVLGADPCFPDRPFRPVFDPLPLRALEAPLPVLVIGPGLLADMNFGRLVDFSNCHRVDFSTSDLCLDGFACLAVSFLRRPCRRHLSGRSLPAPFAPSAYTSSGFASPLLGSPRLLPLPSQVALLLLWLSSLWLSGWSRQRILAGQTRRSLFVSPEFILRYVPLWSFAPSE